MIPTRNLLTLDIPELAAYKTMRRPQEHRDAGLFVAEGEKTVRRLLESPLRVRNLLLPPHWLEEYTPLIQKRFDSGESIDIFTADKKLLESLTGFSFYQGVLAMAEVPAPVEPIQWLATDRARPKTFVAIEDVTNTGNMGMIARNCAALGADLLIAGQRCCSPYIRGAVHASMGTIFRLPHAEPRNLRECLHSLQERGMRLIAAHPRAGSLPLTRSNLRGDVCVVFGSEGPGLTDGTLAQCDEAVEIPMTPGIDSLNVANSVAIFLYEIQRQRELGTSAD